MHHGDSQGQSTQAETRRAAAGGLSRRAFVQRLGALGAGTAAALGSRAESARAQYGVNWSDQLPADQLVAMYTDMLKIRLWETKVKDLILKGGFRGVAHLYVGEEAIAVGICRALRKDDYIASTHRGHGHLIAKGGDMAKMLAEITHKATGYCKGYGGSLHITDVSLGILGMNGIVGAAHLFAAGAAYGIKVRGTDQVAVSFGGDGSLQNSFFTSAANAAAAWKLPWIGVIENNGYQIWVRAREVYGTVDLAKRAEGFGIEGRVVDGNDVLAVYNAAKYAVDKARAGGGPTVIECKTYRWYDHYGAGGARIGVDGAFGLGYRSDREVRDWMAKDPIRRFRHFLISDRVLSVEQADKIEADVAKAVDEAAAFAEAQPVPKPEDGLKNVFAQGAVPLRNV
ncbi:MAG: thiamine pyrophosphate-dependent dehydrogenase E1 component subunit alpha [Thermoguttaceae bacterium]|jgi:pyruvate dehydrogenase E1 component alpha subunit|nr:thiamine pyrophosphate-dependent dehydrogenase E1 component subunit alpha [Thermoguttaceae bacterium]